MKELRVMRFVAIFEEHVRLTTDKRLREQALCLFNVGSVCSRRMEAS